MKAKSAALLVLFLLAAMAASALDLGMQTWVGNLGFTQDRGSTDTRLPGSAYFWGLSIYGTQPVMDNVQVEAGFYSDPILRNVTRTIFTYDAKFLTVGIGPVFGVFNDWGTPVKSGLSASIRLEYPGAVFVSLRSDSSLGGSLSRDGDYTQELTDFTLGFYVPNAICTFELSTRSFEQRTSSQNVTDTLTEYTFAADIFKKNVPYRVRLWLGYQDLSRGFDALGTTTTATLGSVILGTQLELTFPGPMVLTAGLEANVYSFGLGSLVGSDSNFLFRTYAGIKLNLDSNPLVSRFL